MKHQLVTIDGETLTYDDNDVSEIKYLSTRCDEMRQPDGTTTLGRQTIVLIMEMAPGKLARWYGGSRPSADRS